MWLSNGSQRLRQTAAKLNCPNGQHLSVKCIASAVKAIVNGQSSVSEAILGNDRAPRGWDVTGFVCSDFIGAIWLQLVGAVAKISAVISE